MKKIVAINASSRTNGNTSKAVKYFLENECKNGEKIYFDLIDLNINYCRGGLKCESKGRCIQKDDWRKIEKELYAADNIIIGTPIYMGQESALCKTFLERCRSLISYIEALDKDCKSIEELFKKHPDYLTNWPKPISRIKKNPQINIIIIQSQPSKDKYLELFSYLKEILSKIFNSNDVNLFVLTSKLNKNDFNKKSHEFRRDYLVQEN